MDDPDQLDDDLEQGQLSPNESPNYLQVRDLLTSLGHAPSTWDGLAFSLGLLPSLRAHGSALARTADIFKAPVFQSVGWAEGDWPQNLPSWQLLLKHWEQVRSAIARNASKASDNWLDPPLRLSGQARPSNPLRRHGISHAPLVSVLVTRHELSDHPSADRRAVARRFDHLQTLLTAAFIQLKSSSGSTPSDYMDYAPAGHTEFAPFPTSASLACRAGRWLSEAPQAALLDRFPLTSDPHDFCSQVQDWANQLFPMGRSGLQDKSISIQVRRPPTYVHGLATYFLHWQEVLEGAGRKPRTRRGGKRGGSELQAVLTVDGFIPGEVDVNTPAAVAPEFGDNPGHEDATTGAAGTLAPDDLASPVLPLIDASGLNGALSRHKWRAMQAEMAAVVLPWDLRYLAPKDAERIVTEADKVLSQQGEGAATPMNALLTLMSLALGQDPDRLLDTRIALLTEPDQQPGSQRGNSGLPPELFATAIDLDKVLQAPIDSPALLISRVPKTNDEPQPLADQATTCTAPFLAAAFLVPAIRPHLSSSGAKDLLPTPAGPLLARNFLLPATELGRQLLRHWWINLQQPKPHRFSRTPTTRETTPNPCTSEAPNRPSPSLGVQAFEPARDETLSGAGHVARFLDRLPPPTGHTRWPARLFQAHVGTHIQALTGDHTLAWILTHQTDAQSEARLYYTQHGLERLPQVWCQALQAGGLSRLLNLTGHEARDGDGDDSSQTYWERLRQHWPWTTPELAHRVVGAPFVPKLEDVQRLIQVLRQSLSAPINLSRRSELKKHHHWLLLYTLVLQGLCTALRAVRSPTSLLLALEQADRVRHKAGLAASDDDIFAGLADKETYYNQRARLVALGPLLVQQLRCLQQHNLQLVLRLDLVTAWQSAPRRVRAMFRLDDQDQPAEVSVAWLEQALADLGFNWPGNFARAFLRSQLLARGCAAADLDAMLGHRDVGGGPIALHSTFDFPASNARLSSQLAQLHRDLGLKSCPSALAPPAASLADDPDILLAPMHDAGPVGRGRSWRPRHQRRNKSLNAFWQAIHRRATDDDRRQVPVLHRLLRHWARQGNALASLLTQDDPIACGQERLTALINDFEKGVADFAALPGDTGDLKNRPPVKPVVCDMQLASGVQDLVTRLKALAENGTRARFNLAASWFRLLLRARGSLTRAGIVTPDTPLVQVQRPPSSPFIQTAVLAMPIVDGWRSAVMNWSTQALEQARTGWLTREARDRSPPADQAVAGAVALPTAPSVFSAEGWATAMVVSAVVNGMLLDVTQLSMLLRRFSLGNFRDLPISGPEHRAHLDFKVPASGSMDRQTHRWWFDPVTELIWLHAPPMPSELRLGDLHPWLRRLALQAFPGSITMPFEPQGFSDLVRCAEIWWLARASRSVVASQTRQVDASSVITNRWGRLVGARQLVAPHAVSGSASPIQPMAQEPLPETVDGESSPPDSADQASPKASRRAQPASSFEALALVEFHGDRPGDRLIEWQAPSTDEELLAALGSAHPWVQAVADTLYAARAQPQDLDGRALDNALPADVGPIPKTLVAFAKWLAAPSGAQLTGPPLVRSFSAVAQAVLLSLGSGDDGQVLDAQYIAQVINTIDDLPIGPGATPRSVQHGMLRLARFLGVQADVLAAVDPEDQSDLDSEPENESHADARVLSHEEYESVMKAIDETLHPQFPAGERALGRLVLMLCFRLGLRPGEVYGLRMSDVAADHLYVLPYGAHTLKSGNARRRVPHALLMPEDELQRFRTFVRSRLERGAQPPDLLVAQPKIGPANRSHLDRWLHRVMRAVSMDARLRLYHARHSFATWCDLAIRSVDHPQLLRFFAHLPRTRAYLERGPALAVGLFGSQEAALGRTSYALARLVGHIGPAVTHMHYIHGDDLVRAAVVERELLKTPKEDWMRVLGLGRSATFALLSRDVGFAALIRRAREVTGWTTRGVSLLEQDQEAVGTRRSINTPVTDLDAPSPTSTLPARPEASHPVLEGAASADWLALVKLIDLTRAIASGQRSLDTMAKLSGVPSAHLEQVMRGLKANLPRVAQPGERATREAQSGLVVLHLSAEGSALFSRAESWMRGRAMTDPVGLRSELEFVLQCYDRRDRDFHVKDAGDLKRLLTLLSGMGMTPTRARLVVRALTPEAGQTAPLPACATADALGAYAGCPVKVIGVRVAAKAASYAKWMGVMPVMQSGEGCSNVLATAAAIGLSQVAV